MEGGPQLKPKHESLDEVTLVEKVSPEILEAALQVKKKQEEKKPVVETSVKKEPGAEVSSEVVNEKWESELEVKHRQELKRLLTELESAAIEADGKLDPKIALLSAKGPTDFAQNFHDKYRARQKLLKLPSGLGSLFTTKKTVNKNKEQAQLILQVMKEMRGRFEPLIEEHTSEFIRFDKAIENIWKNEGAEINSPAGDKIKVDFTSLRKGLFPEYKDLKRREAMDLAVREFQNSVKDKQRRIMDKRSDLGHLVAQKLSLPETV